MLQKILKVISKTGTKSPLPNQSHWCQFSFRQFVLWFYPLFALEYDKRKVNKVGGKVRIGLETKYGVEAFVAMSFGVGP